MRVVIIGLGGIGTALTEFMCRYINYKEELNPRQMMLVDGDTYELKNMRRQIFKEFGNKAEIKADELELRFRDIEFDVYPSYVNQENIGDVIRENDMVMLCVDNHKTRKIVNDYCSTCNNVTLISGGNDWIDGNTQLYIRKDGADITPSLTAYHPEIANPADKSPEELSCEELSTSAPQLFFTNAVAAVYMCLMFYNVVNSDKVPASEVYFDIELMSALSKVREVR